MKNILSIKQKSLTVLLSVFASVSLVAISVFAATTIGTNITTTGSLSVTGASTLTGAVTSAGNIIFGSDTTTTTEARFLELTGGGTNYVGMKAPDAITANVIWTLPSADGSANQTLVTDGSGALSWASGLTTALTAGNIFVGNASNVATSTAMSGDATLSNAGALTVANSAVIGKVLTGYASGAGTVAATDTILQSINKLNGNDALALPLAGGTMTGILAMGANNITGTGTVSATTFVGALTGNASTATSATSATTATTATNATNTAITNDATTATAVYPTWVTANTGNLPQKTTSTALSFVPSTGILTATGFAGPLVGNVMGNASGLSATLAIGSGGTGLATIGAGNILYTSAGDTLTATPISVLGRTLITIADGAANQVLQTNGAGVLSWTPVAGTAADNIWTGVNTFGGVGNVSRLKIAGTTSGSLTLNTDAIAGTAVITIPAVTDILVGRATTDTLTNKTLTSPVLITPNLGTPSVLVGTNISGTGASFTAGTVTTNANLTGAITSTGNATILGTGSFSSANLLGALSDKTGTGLAVFAISPTFTGQVKKSVQAGVTANTGSTQATGTVVTSDIVEVTTVAVIGDAVTLPVAVAGMQITVINRGANALGLFPGAGGNINLGGLNLEKAVAANATVICSALGAVDWECNTLAR